MPVERPWVMSNMLVTIWNSAIASRLTFGWPKPDPATRCVICWPSRLSWNWLSIAPGVLLTLLAVMPLTINDSSCQLRPCSGSSAIWRRSMFAATCDDRTSTSGVSPLTVTVSSRLATFIAMGGTVALAPTSSSRLGISVVAKPGSSMRTL